MTDWNEQTLGRLFGILGGGLLLLGGLVALLLGTVDLAMGHAYSAVLAGSAGVVLIVMGALALVFSHLAKHSWANRPAVSGIILMVVALVAWVSLAAGSNLIAVLGAIFVFLAGVLYLVTPAVRAAGHLASA